MKTLFLVRHHPAWSPGLKLTLALTPLLPGLLYLRNGLQLLQGLDEMQRRIQLEGWLFAALGTVVVSTIINVCNAQGLGGNSRSCSMSLFHVEHADLFPGLSLCWRRLCSASRDVSIPQGL